MTVYTVIFFILFLPFTSLRENGFFAYNKIKKGDVYDTLGVYQDK